jgi:uncharacterized protein (UPF0276 family)
MRNLTALPPTAGIGLRAPHHAEVMHDRPAVAWWEVHSENFFADGGPALDFLRAIRADYPLSLHGVGASLGGVDSLFELHLDRLARLAEIIEPAAISEHLCWSSVGDQHFNDLLPLPSTEAAVVQAVQRIERMQERLQRTILIENVSSYVQWREADYSEWDFLVEVARRAGCGILLDVNNIHVSASNHGFDARTYVDAVPPELVGEIHLAGYDQCEDFLVDTHGKRVHPPVWELYEYTLERLGPRPTLIEWDTDIPALDVLQDEAAYADRCLARVAAAEVADAAL